MFTISFKLTSRFSSLALSLGFTYSSCPLVDVPFAVFQIYFLVRTQNTSRSSAKYIHYCRRDNYIYTFQRIYTPPTILMKIGVILISGYVNKL